MKRNQTNHKYRDSGISVTPAVLAKGDTAQVRYQGLLARSGAEKLYVHVGYGGNWERAIDYKMIRTPDGFEAQVPVAAQNGLKICFHDNANNWDNNSGQDYSFEVSR
ncbi:MAG TPA: carbohydrate-binding protein [Selenomonadales bacterium]|nr:carbohydrate-binding protein [Selenomonadales bacterium]